MVSTHELQGAKPPFSDERLKEVQAIISKFPEGRQKSALIRVLHMAEEDFGGWLSQETMDYVASLLDIQPVEVYEVATFYTMFNLEPTGKFVFEVCRTGPCMLVGSDQIIEHIKNRLGISKVGETSADGIFTLKTSECLGACGYAPMLQCGKVFHEHLTPEKVDQLIEDYRAKYAQLKNQN
jgi:NADH-quinone oxidoreductase subunit E